MEETFDISEFKDHFALHGYNIGCSSQLRGEVVIVAFLVNDLESSWNDRAIDDYKQLLEKMAENVMRESGLPLDKLHIAYAYKKVRVPYRVDHHNHSDCVKDVLRSFGYDTAAAYQKHYKEKFSRDEAPLLFVMNKNFRSFAIQQTGTPDFESKQMTNGDEWSIISYTHGNPGNYTITLHEMLHQFGAVDYYFIEKSKLMADKYLPESIMNGGSRIDSLTRFNIGWDEEPDENAVAFMRAVQISKAEYEIYARKNNQNM